MGHHISAIIGKAPINEDKINEYSLAVAYEGGFAIIILDEGSIPYWSRQLKLSDDTQNDYLQWECELVFHFAKEVGLHKFAIIQTEYVGGYGDQYASVFEAGEKIAEGHSINDALKRIGVECGTNDEFDTINLGEYRNSEYYYWDNEHNQALGKANMIPGKMFKWNYNA